MVTFVRSFVTITLLCLGTLMSHAQATDFLYQGQLQNTGSPANGMFDLEFALFDSATGGGQVGSTVARSGVQVSNGIFSVELNFGNQFPGTNRFLEIRVRPAGGGAFTTLLPRQPLTSAPYSIKSLNADNATSAATATNATNAANAQNAVTFSGTLGGDVTGTQSATTVARLQGRSVAATAPTNGQVLKFNSGTGQWEPASDETGAGGGGGDISSVNAGTGLTGGGTSGDVTLGITNGGVNTAQLADGSVTDTKIVSVSGAKVTGTVANAANATTATTATNFTGPLAGDVTGTQSGTAIAPNAVTTGKIADNSVTDAKIQSGQVVKSINSLKDNVTLAAGTNVTITPSGNTLTIAAAGGGITGSGTPGRLPVFSGTGSLGDSNISQSGTNIGIGTGSPTSKLDVRGNLTLDAGVSPVLYTGTAPMEQNRYLQIVNSAASPTPSGLKVGGLLVSDTLDYDNPAKDQLIVKGKVGIGRNKPAAKLDVFTTEFIGVRGESSSPTGIGVSGSSFDGTGVRATGVATGSIALRTAGTSWFTGDTTPLQSSAGKGVAVGFAGENGYIFSYDHSASQPKTLALNHNGGNVGIGTTTPGSGLELRGNGIEAQQRITDASSGVSLVLQGGLGSNLKVTGYNYNTGIALPLYLSVDGANTIMNIGGGRVGIGTTVPDQALTVNGNASKPGGGTWSVFSDERLKNVSGRYTRGIADLMRLSPIRFSYKADNELGLSGEGEYIGFSAQEVQDVVPEAVSRSTNGYLQVNSDAILWTMLNSIKEQQKQIEDKSRMVEEQERRLRKQQSEIDGLRKALCAIARAADMCRPH